MKCLEQLKHFFQHQTEQLMTFLSLSDDFTPEHKLKSEGFLVSTASDAPKLFGFFTFSGASEKIKGTARRFIILTTTRGEKG